MSEAYRRQTLGVICYTGPVLDGVGIAVFYRQFMLLGLGGALALSACHAPVTTRTTAILSKNQTAFNQTFLGLKTTGVQIEAVGDDLTYGIDTASTDRVPAFAPAQPSRASTTYPMAFQTALIDRYHRPVTVINKGLPALTATQAAAKLKITAGTQLALFMLGSSEPPLGPLDEFKQQYRSLLKRYQDAHSAVVVIPPLFARTPTLNAALEPYRQISCALAREASAPCLDGLTVPSDGYSDDIHLNTEGYRTLGQQIARRLTELYSNQ